MLVIIEPMAADGTTTVTVDGESRVFEGGELGHILAFHAAAQALAPDEEAAEDTE